MWASHRSCWLLNEGKYDSVKALIAAGADANAIAVDGSTALMSAANSDDANPDCVKALINASANVNAQDKEGKTALDKAHRKNYPDVVAALKAALTPSASPSPRRPPRR